MKQSKLEMFSPTNDGQLVNEATYLKHMLQFASEEWKGIQMNETLVKKVWEKVKKNTYLEDNAADEVAEMYEKMAFDYEAAVDLSQSKESEPIVNDNPEPDNEKLELVECVKDGLELSSFTKTFDLGAGLTQCVPKGKVDMKDWVKAFAFGLTLESGSQWIIGDAVVALENAGHEDVVNQLCAQFKKNYSTVSGYARTCRAFPNSERDPMLPFTVYREIGNADLKKPNMLALLDAAKKESLSSQEVRGRVREAQGKEEPMKQLPHRFLILNVSNFSNSEVVREVPDEIEPHQLVIDLRSQCWFDPAENEWMNFLKGE
jgi:hypothetical protein